MQLEHRLLDRAEAYAPCHVGRHEDETVAGGDVAVPYLRPLDVLGGHAAVGTRVGESEEPRLPDHVRLGRTDRGNVQFVAPDHGQGEADRCRLVGADSGAFGPVEEDFVGGPDRLP